VQFYAVGTTLVYSAIGTLVICKVVDVIFGIRVNEKDETIGLDLTQHNEKAYTVLE
jgi:Amt family ammonium transporter